VKVVNENGGLSSHGGGGLGSREGGSVSDGEYVGELGVLEGRRGYGNVTRGVGDGGVLEDKTERKEENQLSFSFLRLAVEPLRKREDRG